MLSRCLFLLFGILSIQAFVPAVQRSRTSQLNALTPPPQLPPVEINMATTNVISQQQQSPLEVGISKYNTQLLSLEERRPPTAEEIAAKKRNFNLWFWGGGFVAPFLATIFYFGFRFWEK